MPVLQGSGLNVTSLVVTVVLGTLLLLVISCTAFYWIRHWRKRRREVRSQFDTAAVQAVQCTGIGQYNGEPWNSCNGGPRNELYNGNDVQRQYPAGGQLNSHNFSVELASQGGAVATVAQQYRGLKEKKGSAGDGFDDQSAVPSAGQPGQVKVFKSPRPGRGNSPEEDAML